MTIGYDALSLHSTDDESMSKLAIWVMIIVKLVDLLDAVCFLSLSVSEFVTGSWMSVLHVCPWHCICDGNLTDSQGQCAQSMIGLVMLKAEFGIVIATLNICMLKHSCGGPAS